MSERITPQAAVAEIVNRVAGFLETIKSVETGGLLQNLDKVYGAIADLETMAKSATVMGLNEQFVVEVKDVIDDIKSEFYTKENYDCLEMLSSDNPEEVAAIEQLRKVFRLNGAHLEDEAERAEVRAHLATINTAYDDILNIVGWEEYYALKALMGYKTTEQIQERQNLSGEEVANHDQTLLEEAYQRLGQIGGTDFASSKIMEIITATQRIESVTHENPWLINGFFGTSVEINDFFGKYYDHVKEMALTEISALSSGALITPERLLFIMAQGDRQQERAVRNIYLESQWGKGKATQLLDPKVSEADYLKAEIDIEELIKNYVELLSRVHEYDTFSVAQVNGSTPEVEVHLKKGNESYLMRIVADPSKYPITRDISPFYSGTYKKAIHITFPQLSNDGLLTNASLYAHELGHGFHDLIVTSPYHCLAHASSTVAEVTAKLTENMMILALTPEQISNDPDTQVVWKFYQRARMLPRFLPIFQEMNAVRAVELLFSIYPEQIQATSLLEEYTKLFNLWSDEVLTNSNVLTGLPIPPMGRTQFYAYGPGYIGYPAADLFVMEILSTFAKNATSIISVEEITTFYRKFISEVLIGPHTTEHERVKRFISVES